MKYVLQIAKPNMIAPMLAGGTDDCGYCGAIDVYPAAVSDDPYVLELKGRALNERYPSSRITWHVFEVPEVTR